MEPDSCNFKAFASPMKIPPLSPSVRFRNSLRCAGFTLVEMLVVISIMLTLMGLVSAALVGVGRAHSLANAGNQLAAMVTVARQNSMTKNALTAVVIPAGKSNWNAWILYELTPGANGGNATTADWRPISKWASLPPGIAINDCDFVAQNVPKDFPDLPSLVPARGEAVSTYRYIVFTPTGALYPFPQGSTGSPNQGENPAVRLVEGIRIGEDPENVEYTGTTKGDQASFYRVTILRSTGIAKVDRL